MGTNHLRHFRLLRVPQRIPYPKSSTTLRVVHGLLGKHGKRITQTDMWKPRLLEYETGGEEFVDRFQVRENVARING